MTARSTSRKAGEPTTKPQSGKSSPRREGRRTAGTSFYTVFVSHSSKEEWIARQIAKEIEALGAKTWLDVKDLRGGDEIRRSIKRGIRASQEAIVLLSADSITSQWFIYEAGIADGQGKRITPILNNLAPNEALAPLEGVKAIDLNEFEKFLVELAGRIKKRLGKTRKAAVWAIAYTSATRPKIQSW